MSIVEFIKVTLLLTKAGEFAALREFFSLVRELLAQPTLQIVPGEPTDKELT